MKQEKAAYRSEGKYPVTTAQIALLKSRIKGMMRQDLHTGADGSYHVRSLYFDDYDNRCFYENEDGIAPREKFRIRIYDYSTDTIMLECKRKERDKTQKSACLLTMEQAKQLMQGDPVPMGEDTPALLRKINLQILTRRLHPVVIVDYDRAAYVHPDGNVRVTFDTNLSASADIESFFLPRLHGHPVMPAGQQLLEVKYDEYLPAAIRAALNLGQLRQTTFSKFYLCRKKTLQG